MRSFKLYDSAGEMLLGLGSQVDFTPPEAIIITKGKMGQLAIEDKLFSRPQLVLHVQDVPKTHDLYLENERGDRQFAKVVSVDEGTKRITVEGLFNPGFLGE